LKGLDAIDNSNASQWIFYWDYEYPGCSSSTEPAHKATTGATVIANNSVSDFALLKLTQDPRNLTNFIPYYLGWDRSSTIVSGVGIHHPKGDVKKISTSTQIQNQSAQITISGDVCLANTHWKIIWNAGTTEGGSSGSPFINNNKKVIGQLHGGNASCTNLSASDYYGKFSVSWTGNGATDNRRKLQPWLNPAGTNPTTLDGKSYASITGPKSICDYSATYTIANKPANATVTWSCSSNLSRTGLNGTTSNSATFYTYGSSAAWVQAVVNINGTNYTLPKFSSTIYGFYVSFFQYSFIRFPRIQ
jgi:hypothetical protein